VINATHLDSQDGSNRLIFMNPYETNPRASVQGPKTSGLAIASLVTAVTCIAPAAIITGHIALSQIKASAGQLTGRGLALAGTIIGYVGLAFYLFTLVIPVFFVGARAWKKGSDRAACIITQRNIQQAVRYHQSHHGLAPGAPLDMKAVISEYQLEVTMTCPTGQALEISKTIPPTGELAVKCPHAHDLGHEPTVHSDW
jgi:hypothetical protein